MADYILITLIICITLVSIQFLNGLFSCIRGDCKKCSKCINFKNNDKDDMEV